LVRDKVRDKVDYGIPWDACGMSPLSSRTRPAHNELVQLTLYPAALRAPGHSAADHGVGQRE